MYPLILIGDVRIYTFGIFLIIAWAILFSCLLNFSQKKGIVKPVFSDIITFTLTMFFFGRIFYILSQWRKEKFLFQNLINGELSLLEFFKGFFITDNYNIALFGVILGFSIVFFIKNFQQKTSLFRYIDIIIPSFLISGIVGYLGSLFGGQVYGIPFESVFSLDYNTKYSEVEFQTPLFPLPILYITICIIILIIGKILYKKNLPDGYVGSIMLGLSGLMLFFGEFLNGTSDMFSDYLRLNQIMGLTFVIFSFIGLLRISRS